MSEFPWELKKDSNKESSNAEKSGSGSPGFENKSGANPSIPDILANAFSEAPMEEVRLESSPSSEPPVEQDIQSAPPGLGNIADLSDIASGGGQGQSEPPNTSSNDVPSFMQAGNDSGEINKNEISPSQDLFNISDIGYKPPVSGNPSAKNTENSNKQKKRSPPPLFKPILPGEENDGLQKTGSEQNVPKTDPAALQDKKPDFPQMQLAFEQDNDLGSPFPDSSPFFGESVENLFPHPEETISGNNPIPEDQSQVSEPPADDYGQPSSHEVPFSASMPNFNSPLPDYVEPSDNPFSDSPVSSAPSPDPVSQADNPFSGSPDSPVPENTGDPFSPFAESKESVQNPFPGPASQPGDPFSDPMQQHSNPFPDFAAPAPNPFPDSGSSPGDGERSSGLIGSIGGSITVDKFIRNFDGIGERVKSLFSGLTKGQSLLERMDELTDNRDVLRDEISSSPFDESSQINMPFPPESTETGPFSFTQEGPSNMGEPGEGSPFSGTTGQVSSGSIQKVTPISEPLTEIKEEHRFDPFAETAAENEETSLPLAHEDITRTIPVDNPGNQINADSFIGTLSAAGSHDRPDVSGIMEGQSWEDNSEKDGSIPKDELIRMGQMSTDIEGLRSELEVVLSRFEDVEGNVSNLSEKVSGFGPLISSGTGNEELLAGTAGKVESLDGKVDALEGKVHNLESSLVSVQSDNENIRSSLTRIEENVAELVNSYTALLVQVHESAQETDERFSQIESALEVLKPLEARFSSIEKTQEEARSTSMELARSVSSLVDELGTTSSGFNEFRQDCEARQGKLEENIGSVTEYLDSELKKLGARSYKGFGQNVHLSNIMKNSTNMKLCMEWLEFLMELVGRNNLPDILSYYEDLGWITEDVRVELLHYAEGIDFYMEKPDWKLTPDDHVKSIWFIESLAGMKVDKNRLSVIERDIEKVKKGNEIYCI